jgi:hypothetical protein
MPRGLGRLARHLTTARFSIKLHRLLPLLCRLSRQHSPIRQVLRLAAPRSRPGYINYTVGKLEILKLRDDYQAKVGDKFSLIDFHDRLLAGGLVPIKIIRREMMGEDGPVL